ncbi:ABC transporter substrate-binding protein [Mycoplasmatota bacterium zrk1]
MKKLLALTLVLGLSLSLGACTKEVEVEKIVEKEVDKIVEVEVPVDVVEPEGTVRVGNTSFNGQFFDGWGNSSYDNNIRRLVFGNGGLLCIGEDAKYHQNFMVESYEDNGMEFIFHLNQGIQYSTGEEFTADDVIYTYEFYMDVEALTAVGSSTSLPEYLESVEKIDEYTVKFNLKERIYTTLGTVFTQYIISEDQIEEFRPADITPQQHVYDSLLSQPVGMGPYKLEQYAEGQFVKLTWNPYYTGNYAGDVPSIRNVVVRVVSDVTDIDELLTNNIDILAGVVDEDKIDAAKDSEDHTFNNYDRHGYGHITFHNDFDVTKYKEVRKAIAYATDRQAFISDFLGAYGRPVQGPYSTNFPMVTPEFEASLINYQANADKVAEVLEAEGWAKGDDGIYAKNGEKLIINVACGTKSWKDSFALIWEGSVEEYGIQFNVHHIDFAVLLDHYYGFSTYGTDVSERKYHAFALATSYNGPDFDGYANWHSDKVYDFGAQASGNTSRFEDAQADEYLMNMRQATTYEVYEENYQAWVTLMNDNMPLIPMYSNDYHDLYSSRLENLNTGPIWGWADGIVKATLND